MTTADVKAQQGDLLEEPSSELEPSSSEASETALTPIEVLELPSLPDAEPAPGALSAVTIRNPSLFALRSMRELFLRAFAVHEKPHLPNAIEAIEWAEQFCTDPTTGIIVAVEGLEPDFEFRGLAILDYNPGPWTLAPQCLHFHSTGSDVVRVLSDGVASWLTENGQNELVGINMTGASDKAHARLFRKSFKSEVLGSVLMLRKHEVADDLE